MDGAVQESAGEVRGQILVSAASSLADAFPDLARAFEAVHPGTVVVVNLGGSSSLRRQIVEGAPVDVFASADVDNMEALAQAGALAGPPRVMARNALRIAVPAGNPAQVGGLGDFDRESLRIGLCAEVVPCGALAAEAFRRAGVTPRPDTREPNVRALLTKVALGELDAGITYATDVAAASGEVVGLPIPPEHAVTTEYPLAVLAGSPNPAAARAFVAFALSAGGQAILVRHGFSPP
jgi:molybdate transport system substrate-binding protein